jgi:hypothetical protein
VTAIRAYLPQFTLTEDARLEAGPSGSPFDDVLAHCCVARAGFRQVATGVSDGQAMSDAVLVMCDLQLKDSLAHAAGGFVDPS